MAASSRLNVPCTLTLISASRSSLQVARWITASLLATRSSISAASATSPRTSSTPGHAHGVAVAQGADLVAGLHQGLAQRRAQLAAGPGHEDASEWRWHVDILIIDAFIVLGHSCFVIPSDIP